MIRPSRVLAAGVALASCANGDGIAQTTDLPNAADVLPRILQSLNKIADTTLGAGAILIIEEELQVNLVFEGARDHIGARPARSTSYEADSVPPYFYLREPLPAIETSTTPPYIATYKTPWYPPVRFWMMEWKDSVSVSLDFEIRSTKLAGGGGRAIGLFGQALRWVRTGKFLPALAPSFYISN